MKVLFICTGNTCRSCMAEGFLRAIADNDAVLKDKLQVASAGLAAYAGEPASTNAVLVLKNGWSIDIGSHRARCLDASLIQEACLILTMTRMHKNTVIAMYPEAASKVFTLREYSQGVYNGRNNESFIRGTDIADPYGMPIETYKRCAEEIRECVERAAARMKGEWDDNHE